MGLLNRLLGRPLDRDEFAGRIRAALAEAGFAATYDKSTFALGLPAMESDPSAVTLYLETIYADYLRLPSDRRDALIQSTLSTVSEMYEATPTPERARAALRVQLRPRVWAERYVPLRRVVAERLALCLCLDRPTSMRYISLEELTGWGLDEATAFDLAMAGLERDTGTTGGLERAGAGVYRSMWGDTYDAARAALPWLVRKVPSTGGHVLAVPNRDTLLVADAGDVTALKALAALSEQEAEHPRRVSYLLLTLRDDELVPLQLPEDHPAYAEVRNLELRDALDQASAQKDLVMADLASRDEDVFVATLTAIRTPAGQLVTYTTWVEDVDTLLPLADVVAFVSADQPDQMPRLFRFAQVQTQLGELMQPADECGYPPRFRVRSYPTVEQFAHLGEQFA